MNSALCHWCREAGEYHAPAKARYKCLWEPTYFKRADCIHCRHEFWHVSETNIHVRNGIVYWIHTSCHYAVADLNGLPRGADTGVIVEFLLAKNWWRKKDDP